MYESLSPIGSYSKAAKLFHWLTAALFMIQFPIGYIIVQIESGILASFLFDFHKLIGLVIFWIAVFRAAYRVKNRGKRGAAKLAPWHRLASRSIHAILYGLLFSIPILGWLGISAMGDTIAIGTFKLPSLLEKDMALSAMILFWHAVMAFVLLGAVFVHIAIAMQGYLEADSKVLMDANGQAHSGQLPVQP